MSPGDPIYDAAMAGKATTGVLGPNGGEIETIDDEEDPRPAQCCGACPEVAGGGYDCTCPDNPRCPHTDPVALTRKWDESDLSDVSLTGLMDLAKRLADKVEQIREELDTEQTRAMHLAIRAVGCDEATAAIQRVRALHHPVSGADVDWPGITNRPLCAECTTPDHAVAHPCPTSRALDGGDPR